MEKIVDALKVHNDIAISGLWKVLGKELWFGKHPKQKLPVDR